MKKADEFKSGDFKNKKGVLFVLKLVIFDLDGTLVDAYPAITASFNFTMQKLGYPTQKEIVIRKAVGWGDENLLKPFVKDKDLDKAIGIYRRHHKLSLLKKASILKGVFRVLKFLKRKKIKIAVASNRPSKFSWIIIKRLNLDRYLDYVLCADNVKYIKPHPYLLNKIMQHFKVLPYQTLYIGDMSVDVKAGKAAGIKTVAVTTGSHTKKEVKQYKPFKIISKITGLIKIIKEFKE